MNNLRKVLLLGVILSILTPVGFSIVNQNKHPSEYTVKIMNMMGNSGGSGVIIQSSENGSTILTNSHVCGVLNQGGGKVIKTNGEEHVAIGVIHDTEADLCLITVAADLGVAIKVAKTSPDIYTDGLIAGNPKLMPTVITKGHFGGREIIPLVWGIKPCSLEDMRSPQTGMVCILAGGIPIIRHFDSRIVTATIMPGSSGSPVLNTSGELSGLVFAGNSRDLSYAFTVPLEAIHRFLLKAVTEKPEVPWANNTASITIPEREEVVRKLREICKTYKEDLRVSSMCNQFNVEFLGELL